MRKDGGGSTRVQEPLDYAPGPAGEQLRRVLGRMMLVCVALFLCYSGYRLIAWYVPRAAFLEAQGACLRHAFKEGEVVYDENAGAAGAGALRMRPDGSMAIWRDTPEWSRYCVSHRFCVDRQPVVFLGERVSSGGVRRLVCISYVGRWYDKLEFCHQEADVASLWRGGESGCGGNHFVAYGSTKPITIYGGMRTADSDGVEIRIDGDPPLRLVWRLVPDGNGMLFEVVP